MSHNPQKTTIRFLSTLLKYQVETLLGKDKVGAISEILLKGEIQKRVDYWLLQENY